MSQPTSQQRPPSGGASRRDLSIVYSVEGIACFGTNLLLLGIYFYTHERLGWTLRQNFLLAAGQGLIGAVGALSAHAVAARFSRRGALSGTYALMAVTALATMFVESAGLVTALLLTYTLLTSFTWPMLESLASQGASHHELSRRVGLYNLVWSATGAVIIAISGLLIKHAPWAVFVIPVVVHGLSAGLMLLVREPAPDIGGHGHADAEPELLAVRRLALALSRVSLPATYVVIYSMMALMPSLPAIKTLTPTMATLVCSVWMVARWLSFLVLGATVWWHARPRILLIAAIAMVPAFLGIAVPGSLGWLWEGASVPSALTWMIGSQVVLGVAVGVIYSGSLYFGMALSEGSTEHGGYHEALINFGSAVGPLAGVVAEMAKPGHIPTSVGAVTAVIGCSVVATVVTSVVAGRRPAGAGVTERA